MKDNVPCSSKCAMRGCKKARFIKEQEASRLISILGIKILIISRAPLLGNVLF